MNLHAPPEKIQTHSMLAWYLLGRISFIYLTKKLHSSPLRWHTTEMSLRRWAGWALAHSEFGISVHLIPTREIDYAHHITSCPPEFENLTTSLH